MNAITKEWLLNRLISYKDNMSEFDVEEMAYLISLVRKDLNEGSTLQEREI